MYNAATQVQDSIDANLGSYFQKIKIAVGASPTAFPFKKKKFIPSICHCRKAVAIKFNVSMTTTV
jgi:hypothetical protein